MIRPIGFGLAVGVLVDAVLVRMTLTPAVMHLLGDRAWYIPRWLDRLLPDLDVEGVKLAERLESGALGGAPTASEHRSADEDSARTTAGVAASPSRSRSPPSADRARALAESASTSRAQSLAESGVEYGPDSAKCS